MDWGDWWLQSSGPVVVLGGCLLLALCVLFRFFQRRLIRYTENEIDRLLQETESTETTFEQTAFDQTTADATSTMETVDGGIVHRRSGVRRFTAELDDDEIAATNLYREAGGFAMRDGGLAMADGGLAMADVARLPRAKQFSDLVKERHVADNIGKQFEELKTKWTQLLAARQGQEEPVPDPDMQEIEGLVNAIDAAFFDLKEETFKDDKVAQSQCMSLCCTHLLKHDGLNVLEAIRKTHKNVEPVCTKIIETTVPVIWAT